MRCIKSSCANHVHNHVHKNRREQEFIAIGGKSHRYIEWIADGSGGGRDTRGGR